MHAHTQQHYDDSDRKRKIVGNCSHSCLKPFCFVPGLECWTWVREIFLKDQIMWESALSDGRPGE